MKMTFYLKVLVHFVIKTFLTLPDVALSILVFHVDHKDY